MDLPAGSIVFADTNVLLTATDAARKRHDDAVHIWRDSAKNGVHLAVSGQVVREYLVVATRPVGANGLGMRCQDALSNVEAFLKRAVVYDENEAVCVRLRALVSAHGLTGVRIHDANIVATMQCNGVTWLLTENGGDFSGWGDVTTCSIEEFRRGME
jgi:predicted nucleic acid-binding protein